MPGRGRTRGPSSDPDERDAVEEGGAVGGVFDMEEKGSEPTLSDLASLLRAHLGQQKAKEDYWTREAAKQEQKFEELEKLFSWFKSEIQSQTTSPVRPTQPPDPGLAASLQHSLSGSANADQLEVEARKIPLFQKTEGGT
ncbi:uncharacterized protein LOC124885079 isoform X3 [Girardinichthys multiradiatus]|uniref:uncharacterized protein LOC124885079 isoform X3 n=1 Tax=Girardinichthys multiradiatus TaxID=208333 RepID=UPI001FAC2952|nr:uncharacterized protein LOC124885079 isoform X3 [Girardinichthys multiradiatus]